MIDSIRGLRSATALTFAAALAAVLPACSDDDTTPAAAATPQMTLIVTATEAFPGTYGSVGAYEKLTGTLAGEVDPKDKHNAIIQDLALAPVNARGLR